MRHCWGRTNGYFPRYASCNVLTAHFCIKKEKSPSTRLCRLVSRSACCHQVDSFPLSCSPDFPKELLKCLKEHIDHEIINSIGHRNATCLKTLRFIVDEPDDNEETPEIEQMIEVIMTLLKHHTCSLSDLEIILNTENDQSYWDIDEEAPTQPCRNLNGPTQFPTVEEAIYDALKEPIQQLPGLKNLHFEGFGRDPFINEELVKFERDVVGYPSNGGADLTSSSPPLHLSPLVELTKLQ